LKSRRLSGLDGAALT